MMLYEMSDRERQILYNFTYRWNLQKQNRWTNMTKQEHTPRHREQSKGCPRGGVEERSE